MERPRRCSPLSTIQSHLSFNTTSILQREFRIGIWLFTAEAPRGCLIHIFDTHETSRDFTYIGVMDQQLQDQIEDLQVHVRSDQSVVLGEGVYRIADMLMMICLLCERQYDEQYPFASLLYRLWHEVRVELREELRKELERYQDLLSIEGDFSWIVWEYRYSVAVYLTGSLSYRRLSNGEIVESTLMTPCRALGGFEFRFWEESLESLHVPWECSAQINLCGLFFEPNTFGDLPRLEGWSAPVPHVEHTNLSVIQPPWQLDAERALGQRRLQELKTPVGNLEGEASSSRKAENGSRSGSEIDDESQSDKSDGVFN